MSPTSHHYITNVSLLLHQHHQPTVSHRYSTCMMSMVLKCEQSIKHSKCPQGQEGGSVQALSSLFHIFKLKHSFVSAPFIDPYFKNVQVAMHQPLSWDSTVNHVLIVLFIFRIHARIANLSTVLRSTMGNGAFSGVAQRSVNQQLIVTQRWRMESYQK